MKKYLSRGFTLIEVMIVLAIIAIITAIALPSYESHVQTTRRGAAAGCLLEIAQQMERRYVSSLTYNATTTLPPIGCVTDQAANYTFEFTTGNPQTTTYSIEAIPAGGQASDSCGNLALNEKTVKKAAGVTDAATVKKCWK